MDRIKQIKKDVNEALGMSSDRSVAGQPIPETLTKEATENADDLEYAKQS